MFKKFFITAMFCFLSTQAYALETGKPAPDFSAPDIAGNQQSLAQYKGKVVVMEWNNPGCPFVKKHYDSKNMQNLQSYAKDKGVIWLAVNSGAPGKQGNMTPAEAKEYVAAEGAALHAYILDPKGEIGHAYGAKTTPHMFVIGADGALVYEGAIDDKPSVDKADIASAQNYVKAAIDAVLKGEQPKMAKTQAYGCSVKYE